MRIPIDKFENWLISKNLKPRTVQTYIYYFNKFAGQIFNQESIARFLADQSNRNSGGRSFLVNYQKFLLVNHKEFNISPELRAEIATVELPQLTGRTKKRVVRPIPHEDVLRLEEHLETEKEKIQLLLSYYCAFRLGELLKIKIISFDWDKWKQDPKKMGRCRVFGKGDKEGLALVPPELMTRIAKFIHSQNFDSVDSYLFRRPHKEYNFSALAREWQLKLSKAGIKAGICQLNEKGDIIKETSVHPHRLRHSYGSYLINVKKKDTRKVQTLLRHSSIQSTQIYTHVDIDQLEEDLMSS